MTAVTTRLHGHFWTLWPFVRDGIRPPRLGPEQDCRFAVNDTDVAPSELKGYLHVVSALRRAEATDNSVLILVHGLGGTANSGYVRRWAAIAQGMGLSTLRISLRGADERSPDLYHAGLIDDLSVVLANPVLSGFSRRYVLGFSLGGHLALRLAAVGSELVDAVATICAPLDLALSAAYIDSPARAGYRRYLLSRMAGMFGVAKAANLGSERFPLSIAEARRIDKMRDWDDAVIAPRFGFSSAVQYYQHMSVAPLLGNISLPTRILVSRADPMVTTRSVQPALLDTSAAVEVVWTERGGHVGFPARNVEADTIQWLLR